MLIHEISAAEERNKKWGAENKIGHSILRQHYGPLGSVGCSLQKCRKQKLHRIAFHRGGGGGSAVKRMKHPNPTGYVPCSFFKTDESTFT